VVQEYSVPGVVPALVVKQFAVFNATVGWTFVAADSAAVRLAFPDWLVHLTFV